MQCIMQACVADTGKYGAFGYCKRHYKRYRSITRKLALIELLGGKCHSCKQTYPLPVFDFHHRDPITKSFEVSKQLDNRTMIVLKEEALKCDLLCANCHRIQHFRKTQWPFLNPL